MAYTPCITCATNRHTHTHTYTYIGAIIQTHTSTYFLAVVVNQFSLVKYKPPQLPVLFEEKLKIN